MPRARELMVEHLIQHGYAAETVVEGEYRTSPFSNEFVQCDDPSRGTIDQGMCFYNRREWRLALNRFQGALDDDPGNAVVLNNICATHNKMDHLKKGIQACRRALELRPAFDRAKNNLAWAERQLASIRNRAKAALRDQDAQAFLAVGHTYYDIGDFSSSLESWQQARSLEPHNPIHSNNVAVAMIALKNYAQAIQMLDAALAIDPEKNLYKNNRRWAQSLLDGEQN